MQHRELPRAVIFDMDGLLLDTEVLAARAWDEAAAALGVTFDRALTLRLVGRNFRDCSDLVHAHYDARYPAAEVLARWHDTYDAIVSREGIAVKQGARELLAWLAARKLPRAVATSTRRERALAKLGDARLLPHFHAVVGGDEVERGKPAPDIHLEAARRLGVSPACCVVLEDSEPGVRAALAAGMTAIMVPDLVRPSPDVLALAPLVMGSLSAVLGHWSALASSCELESPP